MGDTDGSSTQTQQNATTNSQTTSTESETSATSVGMDGGNDAIQNAIANLNSKFDGFTQTIGEQRTWLEEQLTRLTSPTSRQETETSDTQSEDQNQNQNQTMQQNPPEIQVQDTTIPKRRGTRTRINLGSIFGRRG